MAITAEERAASSGNDLVAQTLRESVTAPWGGVLAEYATELDAGDLMARTRRLYIRAAAHLCQAVKLSPDSGLTTHLLKRYLQHNPSARTNIARFLRFGVEKWGWKVAMPSRVQSDAVKEAHELVDSFKAQFSMVQAKGLENASVDDLKDLLATAYGYSTEAFNAVQWSIVVTGDDAFLAAENASFRLPSELLKIAQKWMALQRLNANQ